MNLLWNPKNSQISLHSLLFVKDGHKVWVHLVNHIKMLGELINSLVYKTPWTTCLKDAIKLTGKKIVSLRFTDKRRGSGVWKHMHVHMLISHRTINQLLFITSLDLSLGFEWNLDWNLIGLHIPGCPSYLHYNDNVKVTLQNRWPDTQMFLYDSFQMSYSTFTWEGYEIICNTIMILIKLWSIALTYVLEPSGCSTAKY